MKPLSKLIINNKAINCPVGLFKLGILAANCGVVMELSKRIGDTDKLENIEKAQKKKENAAKDSDDAVLHYGIWVGSGMKVDTNTSNPKLGKEASVAIVEVLFPRE